MTRRPGRRYVTGKRPARIANRSQDPLAQVNETGERFREWTGVILGGLGTLLGLMGFIEARRVGRTADQVRAAQALNEAWDLLAGQEGATNVSSFTKDWTRIEMARRKIEEEALVVEPNSPQGLRYRAALLLAANRLNEAVLAFRAALDADPTSAAAHNNLGVTLLKLDRPAEALLEIQKAIELDGARFFYDNLGSALWSLGRFEEAERAWARGIRSENPGTMAPGLTGPSPPRRRVVVDHAAVKVRPRLFVAVEQNAVAPL